MRKIKKLTSAVVSLMMVCTSMGGFSLWSSADDENVTLDLTTVKSLSLSTNDKKELTYTLNGETKVYSGQIILENGTLENGFTVESGTHAIVLNGVTINDSIEVKKNAIADIILVGTNKVTAKSRLIKNSFLWIDDTVGKAGINVPEGATLNLSGAGELTATGSDDGGNFLRDVEDGGAGIGGNYKESAGTINIKDGTVTAQGGDYAAGIGGGEYGAGGSINISGGTVTAQGGGEMAAGIGGGEHGAGGSINISGGTVNATGKRHAAGIGGGNKGNGGNIKISGGTVNSQGGTYAAGIGGGYAGDSGKIAIENAIVTATGGYGGAGIGGGNGYRNLSGACENITIDNSKVIAITKSAEPIGGGSTRFKSGTVTVNGKDLNKETRNKIEIGSIQINRDGSIIEYPDGKILINKPLCGPQLEKTNSETTSDIQIRTPKKS